MTIDDVNREYAIVGVGNRMVVMQLAADGSIVELWDYEHFKRRLIKEFINVRGADGEIKVKPLADVWLKHRQGRQYDKLVYAMPGSPIAAGLRDYNGWQGFSTLPQAGDWALNRAHLRDVICGGNDACFRWVMNWLAALVQLPGRHAWTALVLRGGQGIGKGHFANTMVGRLFGPQQYLHVLGSGQLTAEFNEHLSGKVLIYADESTWGGDPRAAAKLKGLVTEDTIPIHRKFLKMIDELSMLHIIIASNNEWPIPIEAGDRRFTVLDVSEERKQDQTYFGQLLAELAGGGRAAMLADLLAWPVDEAMLRQPIMTAAKSQIAVQSMKPTEHWWLELLERGSIVDETWPSSITKKALHGNYLAFLDQHHKQSRDRRATETELGMFLRKYTPVDQKLVVNGVRERVVVLPTLAECRAAFIAGLGWPADHPWDNEGASVLLTDVGEAWEPPLTSDEM
jgi:hypothetical protein